MKDCWRIRNDSSGVSGVLCRESKIFPDKNTKKIGDNIHENSLEMTVGGKILLTSKSPAIKSPLRKPIRGCYCNEPKRIQPRSARTIHKQPSTICNHCQSNYELFREKPEAENILLSPSLSCETLRRVQRINYTPRSEFLRRVQQKVSENYDHCHDDKNVDEFLAKKSNFESRQIGGASTNQYQSLKNGQDVGKKSRQSGNLRRRINDDDGGGDAATKSSSDDDAAEEIVVPVDVHRPDESPSEDEITRIHVNLEKTMKKTAQQVPSKTTGTNSRQSLGKNKNSQSSIVQIIRDSSPEIETIFPPRMNYQRKPKKTISSKTLINKNSKNLEEIKINEKEGQKPVRVLSQKSCCYEPCTLNEKKKLKSTKKKKKCTNCCCDCREKCLSHCFQREKPDHNALELRKFRDKNYFDTHGSKASLLSSASSGSLEHFELNDRLFPESVGKIHRDNLVVSMPFCATKELKRIHYFPRHIVQQEKNDILSVTNNLCMKKRKHQNCPLTGHAIDLGVLKAQRPKNSLALKFQKGVF